MQCRMARPLLCRTAHASGSAPFGTGAHPAIIPDCPPPPPAMEADRLNLIDNSLQDLALRSAELRRYL